MNTFMKGFSDELEKLSGAVSSVGKWAIEKPWRRILIPAFIGHAGYKGTKAALKGGRRRVIAARGGRPSKAWYIDYHRALGLPKKLTKLQLQRLSRSFARYRERQ